MKVIVAGATGTAGRGIVKACLDDERITKVVTLTRRGVATDVEEHPKTETVVHDDFSQYPDELMERLKGAEACLWAIGGRVDQFGNDAALARRVGVDYTLAGARAMMEHLAPTGGRSFRFVFCSGKLAEWNQDRPLYFLNDTRKIKGAVESGLCELADANDHFDVFIARPSLLLDDTTPWHEWLFSPIARGISTVQLGKAMIKMALEGSEERIVENETLLKM